LHPAAAHQGSVLGLQVRGSSEMKGAINGPSRQPGRKASGTRSLDGKRQ